MHDRQLAEVLMERLVHRAHERCHWCRKIFRWVDGKFERFKGPDGNYYCCEKRASAQYLSSRGYAL